MVRLAARGIRNVVSTNHTVTLGLGNGQSLPTMRQNTPSRIDDNTTYTHTKRIRREGHGRDNDGFGTK
jgi:hypothetical protein